jgi:DNA invertase Pin-like site-specific DNA recombinase
MPQARWYGLDQEFNSLDAQHEAAEAYVRSQAHDGWTLIRTRYDDGGYSGGSTDRPALLRLVADIRDRRIDIVVGLSGDRQARDPMMNRSAPSGAPRRAPSLASADHLAVGDCGGSPAAEFTFV